MKNQRSVQKSAEASIERAILEVDLVKNHLLSLRAGGAVQIVMPAARLALSELNKAFHEYNAYRNCFET